MSKNHGVSIKTYTRQQLNNYANQHNPNNPAYWANVENMNKMAKKKHLDSRAVWVDYEAYFEDKDDM